MVDPQGLHGEGSLGAPLQGPHVAAMWYDDCARAGGQPPEVAERCSVHQHAAPLVPVDHLAQIRVLPQPRHDRMLRACCLLLFRMEEIAWHPFL